MSKDWLPCTSSAVLRWQPVPGFTDAPVILSVVTLGCSEAGLEARQSNDYPPASATR